MKPYTLYLYISYSSTHNPEPDDDHMAMDYDVVDEMGAKIMMQRFCDQDGNDLPADKEMAKIGFLELHLYNVTQAVNRRFNIYAAFDRSMDTIEMGETIIDQSTGYIKDSIASQLGETLNPNILVIQRFGIYPQWRGKGYGKEVLNSLKNSFMGKAGYIFLKCFPWQCEAEVKLKPTKLIDDMHLILFEQDYKKAQAKLKKYYKSCGFVALKENKDYFGYNLE